jgi:hypothetical protein
MIIENNIVSCTPHEPHSDEDNVTIYFSMLFAPFKAIDSLRRIGDLR